MKIVAAGDEIGGDMPFIKVTFLFCGVAFVIAAMLNVALFIVGSITTSFMVGATHKGWITLLGVWWGVSFLLALQLAKVFRVFPLFMPK